jgi:hypothetical protein
MKIRKIYGIKGGTDPGYEPMAAFNGARAGFVWCADIGWIIERDDQPVDLVVEGYPEPRSFEKPEQRPITIRMIRRGASTPLVQLQVNLLDLVERPTIAASEWKEIGDRAA